MTRRQQTMENGFIYIFCFAGSISASPQTAGQSESSFSPYTDDSSSQQQDVHLASTGPTVCAQSFICSVCCLRDKR